jgi:hypothetical protein
VTKTVVMQDSWGCRVEREREGEGGRGRERESISSVCYITAIGLKDLA